MGGLHYSFSMAVATFPRGVSTNLVSCVYLHRVYHELEDLNLSDVFNLTVASFLNYL